MECTCCAPRMSIALTFQWCKMLHWWKLTLTAAKSTSVMMNNKIFNSMPSGFLYAATLYFVISVHPLWKQETKIIIRVQYNIHHCMDLVKFKAWCWRQNAINWTFMFSCFVIVFVPRVWLLSFECDIVCILFCYSLLCVYQCFTEFIVLKIDCAKRTTGTCIPQVFQKVTIQELTLVLRTG